MPLDHSIESRRAYESSPKGWPLGGLQISSFRALAHKGVKFSKKPFRRLDQGKKKNISTGSDTEGISPSVAAATRRALSISLDEYTTAKQQSQSPLYKLPLEVRQLIYEDVLGCSNIHVVPYRGGRALRHLRCKCSTCPGVAYSFEYGTSWKKEWKCDGTKYNIDGDILPVELLRTCRRIYSEAIDLLYSTNTFSFRDPVILQKFAANLLAQRRAHLRVLHLDLLLQLPKDDSSSAGAYPAGNEDLWTALWDTLQILPALQSLQLRIHPLTGPNRPSQHQALVPLQRLGREQNFRSVKLYLPNNFFRDKWMNEDPFQIASINEWEWHRDRGAAMKLSVF